MKHFFFVFVLFFFAHQAHAIVNIESTRQEYEQDGWYGHASFGFNGKKGNTDKDEIELGTNIGFKSGYYTWINILEFESSEVNNTKNTDKWMWHGRVVREISSRSALEVFIQSEQDESRKLNMRTLFGTGYRHRFSNIAGISNNVGIGAFYSQEKYDAIIADDGNSQLSPEEAEYALRANLYWNLVLPLDESVRIQHTLYIQPDLDNTKDYRVKDEISLSASISHRVGVKFSIGSAYDSLPADTDFENTEGYTPISKYSVDYSTTLTYQF